MKQREKEYLLYYLDQLSLKLKNNISEMQQGLNHINEITKNISQEIPAPTKQIIYDPLSTDKLAEKPPECLIRIKEVSLLVGVSRSTIYRMVNDGSFPQPLDLGSRFKAWQKQTVLSWISALSNN
ncbi:AlpA family transcriptional regulator [Pseudoalteromonas sp. NBT06-2]|uniref:helix-turn-helix transcriptional regulator n=1 Tax=Pseudoalteromonas sp. NBT06-2 TaxID=2025950 RepID=UPI00207547CA|nr:AlpA family transcriptional regulator [Pseudoalteromonas sp. NBT06-2]